MSKKPRMQGIAEEGEAHEGEAPKTEELVKVETMVPKTIINGHVLTVGTVVELTPDEVIKHRDAGVCLGEVAGDDKREVYSVREAYVAKEE